MFKKKEKEVVEKTEEVVETIENQKPKTKKAGIGCLTLIILILILSTCGKNKKTNVADVSSTSNKPAVTEKQNNKEEKDSKKVEENNISATKVIAQDFIEKTIEKQRMAGFAPSADFNVVKYNSEPIKDEDGEEYPISYAVSGQYEEKGNGAIREFFMCIAYKSQEDVDNFRGYCLQYLNQDTGKYFSLIDKEYDVLEKLKELENKK